MAFTPFSYDMEIIAKLSDTPNVDDGLTAYQLKDKFDEAGKAIKKYINDELLPKAMATPDFNGMVKAYGGEILPAEAGKDYQAPIEDGEITEKMLSEGAITAGRLPFSNVAVETAAFTDDTTYEEFPFKAAVALDGALSRMRPEVVFGVKDAMSGNFAPVADSYDGGVYIYASEKPEATITIPTIVLWR